MLPYTQGLFVVALSPSSLSASKCSWNEREMDRADKEHRVCTHRSSAVFIAQQELPASWRRGPLSSRIERVPLDWICLTAAKSPRRSSSHISPLGDRESRQARQRIREALRGGSICCDYPNQTQIVSLYFFFHSFPSCVIGTRSTVVG